MSSIIEGYEYDIFISYRQKDNKYDGWVTEFVDNLKRELESTFKEDISVYFDINPHDGLLETHDVDASLKDKLKCLIFIPIISRTYCDPKSFAWVYEFKTFAEHTAKDKYGLKIKLHNGNVANRILPVRIHDLDNDDIKICESVLGGVLRGVEFIYKEPGVNRSLSPKDHEEKNLNKTNYRNQINKVALAIKEILVGMRAGPATMVKDKDFHEEPEEGSKNKGKLEVSDQPSGRGKLKLISGVAIIILLVIAAIIAYPKIFKRDTLERLRSSGERISVAVMPFQNMSSDTLFNIWQSGLQNLLITSLSNSEELSVRQYETIERIIGSQKNYASLSPSFAADLALKLEAKTVLSGYIYKTGNIIRITANLMDSKSQEIYKSYKLDGHTEDDFFSIIDSLSMLTRSYLEFNKLKNKYQGYEIKDIYTSSAEAFKYYIQGRSYHGQLKYDSAIELYNKSLYIDTTFISPMLMLAYAYGDLERTDESKKWANKAYSKIEKMPLDIQLQIKEVKAAVDKKPEEQIKYILQYLEFNPYSTLKLYALGWVYFNACQWQKAINAFEKGIEMNKHLDKNFRLWIWNYVLLGNAYHKIGEHKREMKIYKDGLNLWPNEVALITFNQSICLLSQMDTLKANEYISKLRTLGQQEHWSESEILRWVANIYFQADLYNKADDLYRSALLKDPQNKEIKNELAYLLISKELDINKGTELIKVVIKTAPVNYNYLYTCGVGLFKQNKIEEAVECLQKSWELRPFYNQEHYQYLEAAKKAAE